MIQYTLFFISSLVGHFLRSARIILISKDSKIIASFINSLTFIFTAVATKFISQSSFTLGMMIEGIASFFGCYLSMRIYEKIKINKK